jgi:hypothetical protein
MPPKAALNAVQRNALDAMVSFFAAAYEAVPAAAVRELVAEHMDARGNVDQDAVMAGLEQLSAPELEAPMVRERSSHTADAAAAASGDASAPLTMQLRPVLDGGFVGELVAPAAVLRANGSARNTVPKLIIILDRSGSMGESVRRLTQRIIPDVAKRLAVPEAEPITVIAFDNRVLLVTETQQKLRANMALTAGSATYMANAITAAQRAIVNAAVHERRPVRMLVLSDGELNDQAETIAASAALGQELARTPGVRINTQAVRFFTSSAQPDTRGLASVLALNTIGEATLMDLGARMEDGAIVDAIASTFADDGLAVDAELESDGEIMTSHPWDTVPLQRLPLRPGSNFVWFRRVPTELKLRATGRPVDFSVASRVSMEDLMGAHSPMKQLMDTYAARMRMLKVVNTPGTLEEMRTILAFFERFD